MVAKTGVVVLAAGHGVIRPGYSKLVETVDLEGRVPAIVEVVGLAHESGAGRPVVLVVNHRFREPVLAALDQYQLRGGLEIVPQDERRGAADAIRCALPTLQSHGCEAFLTLYGDMPAWRPATLQALLALYRDERPAIAMVSVEIQGALTPAALETFGRILRDETGRIVGVVEPGEATVAQLAVTRTVNPSLFVFDHAWFARHVGNIAPHPRHDGYGDEFHVPPLVAMAVQEGARVVELPLADPCEAVGINTPEDLTLVRKLLAARRSAVTSRTLGPPQSQAAW